MDDTAERALRVAVLEARSTMAKTARLLEEFADALDSEAIAAPLPSTVLLDELQQTSDQLLDLLSRLVQQVEG
jgi:hypothetical protein